MGLDHDQALQVGPGPVGSPIAKVLRGPDNPAATRLDATVVLVHGLVGGMLAALEILGRFDGQGLDHGLVPVRLVALGAST